MRAGLIIRRLGAVRRQAVLIVVLVCWPSAAVQAADEAITYGNPLTAKTTVTVGELLAHPEQYVGQTVMVEGRVTDVCPRRGCWIEISDQRANKQIRFKVPDGIIVFPPTAVGKQAVAEGVLNKFELSEKQAIAQAQHLAEEKGEAFDPASITGPRTVYLIQGSGAELR